MIPIILSGGSGSRLWPLSRESYPKQFLPLVSEYSMLRETLERLQGLDGLAQPIVVCNEEHRFLVAEQLREMQLVPQAIVLEPEGRNTAPAVAIGALAALEQDEDALLLVLPADHVIEHVSAFHASLAVASAAARAGELVTFGIVLTAPETGYGYIKANEHYDKSQPCRSLAVEHFVEKPDLATATSYLSSGDYFWNSGMFMFKASAYLAELAQHAPAMLGKCRDAYSAAIRDMDFVRLGEDAFMSIQADSIDYAVMEKTARAVVVPLDAGWNDIGSWSALSAVSAQDEQANVVSGDVLIEDSHHCYVRSESRLVAAIGVRDHVIVETADAVLVASRDRAQDVKRIVERLKLEERSERLHHRRVFRPWGSYESIDEGERFLVKRIIVNPGASLSLQMHAHRAEHWVVVTGTARVTRGDEIVELHEDQSTYIPVGTKHRLENPTKVPLEIIEVQTGGYLGEDDIVRFDDIYGR
ncbi:mannose-1-phosphate guanylyltransferase/mannose-6-phosphate isomerase [Sulfuriflexus sp.]|uniref:mannose-1-phosphate guanylyltransferase/mannose-6-phosphate isomerase n=1 Tax=Sulfuriflexus sp. TaxID=2015443 RepID=UPI0028CF80B5|nr:mannose-1-phosphate guanylyltransferase/mannose-6-phosphate isomerase [Sulfuriflexus sp.]MDT8405239.1 mannose-1-phosphate guanylyltransferase/mannose-6-phosphate isomerase [Sulfuriflexus sp.]